MNQLTSTAERACGRNNKSDSPAKGLGYARRVPLSTIAVLFGGTEVVVGVIPVCASPLRASGLGV
jgi:hypothetical protein